VLSWVHAEHCVSNEHILTLDMGQSKAMQPHLPKQPVTINQSRKFPTCIRTVPTVAHRPWSRGRRTDRWRPYSRHGHSHCPRCTRIPGSQPRWGCSLIAPSATIYRSAGHRLYTLQHQTSVMRAKMLKWILVRKYFVVLFSNYHEQF